MKKLIIVALMVFLLLNFLSFWLSFWPYQNPMVVSGQSYQTDFAAVKTNFQIYLAISISSLVLAVAGFIFTKDSRKRHVI